MSDLSDLITWYMERLDEPPIRTHVRGVWKDPEDGAGSHLGAPDMAHEFAAWLASPFATAHERPHTTEPTALRLRYRNPMRTALAELAKIRVRPDRPNMASALWQLQVAEGNIGRAAALLSIRFPKMGDPRFARHIFATALRRCRAVYREDVPHWRVRTIDKSDAQLEVLP